MASAIERDMCQMLKRKTDKANVQDHRIGYGRPLLQHLELRGVKYVYLALVL